MKTGYVYILSNSKRTVLCTGVTSNLYKRVFDHKKGKGCTFSAKYKTHYLMYYEVHQSMYQAITREKQIKKWNRDWKISLIESSNPEMKDLWNACPDLRSKEVAKECQFSLLFVCISLIPHDML